MKTPPQYRRVAGRTGLFIRHSLWMSADHLLRVRAHPFAEEYRRYYFRDIQAIVLTELPNTTALFGYIATAFSAVLTGFPLLSGHPVWATLCGFITALLFFLSWRRPTCACYVKTLVSTERLPALRRHRKARRVIALLTAEIERVQGGLSGEEHQAQRSSLQGAGAIAARPEVSHYGGAVHWILFALMLLHVILSSACLFFHWAPAGLVDSFVGFALLGSIILASFKQFRTDLAWGVRWAVNLALCWYGLKTLASMVCSFQIATKSSSPLFAIVQNALGTLGIADPIVYFILASVGMFLLRRHQRTFRTPPQIPEAG